MMKKKTVGINHQDEPFEVSKVMKVISTTDINALNKKSQKYDQIYLHLDKLPATKKDPFKFFIEKKLIYQLDKQPNSESPVVVTVKLPKPEDKINLIVKYTGNDNGVEAKFDLVNGGQNIKISLIDNKIDFKQQKESKFPIVKQSSSEKLTVKFFLFNCKASKEKPFTMKVNGKKFYEIFDIQKEITGVVCDLTGPLSGDHIIELHVLNQFQNFLRKGTFNLTKDGNFVKIEVDDSNMTFEQRKDEFQFGYVKQEDGSQKIAVSNEVESIKIDAIPIDKK